MGSYIYIRERDEWNTNNICKLGVTQNIPDRENGYIPGEFERGKFTFVIEIFNYNLKALDEGLKYIFHKYNRYKGGGKEFFDKCIIPLIEPYLQKKNIKYKILSKDEIKELKRKNRVYKKIKKALRRLTVKKAIEISKIIIPYHYQKYVLDIIDPFFAKNNKGKILWACGLGKALLAVLIAKHCNFKSILIGVPSIYLQTQMLKEVLKIFTNSDKILLIGGDNEKSTTNPDQISKFFKDNKEFHIVITTYDSCKLLLPYTFNYKVADESHHLVGDIDGEYNNFHKIVATKTIFMTATPKNAKGDKVFSMDNQEQFGKIIDERTVQWAIDNNKITDYKVCTIKSTTKEIQSIIKSLGTDDISNIEVFIACYMALLTISKYPNLTHQVLYTNTTETADLAKKYIDILLDKKFKFEDIYNKSLHSKSNIDLRNEVDKFKNCKYGIISCVYIFGEGFDMPKLNGVCFSENMHSETRIIQCALRANRLDKSCLNKIAYIILPYIDDGNWCEDSSSFNKIRKILSHLRNNDSNIEQKISVLTVNNTEKNVATKTEKETFENILLENIEELTKLKIRLRHSKCLTSDFTEEEDEYNYIRECNKELNIKSKEEYVNTSTRNKNYIEDAENYFKKKGVWTNWYDFLGVDTKIFIQSKDEWSEFCKDKVKSLEDYQKICDIYQCLPRNPGDFYTHFTNISNEIGLYDNIYY